MSVTVDLVRLHVEAGGAGVVCVGGEYFYSSDIPPLNTTITDTGASTWREVQPPPCPDCEGKLQSHAASSVPGARICTGCGSTFRLEAVTP